jgi:hypothetical protein
VRAVLVVVLKIGAQDVNKMLAADDQEVVEALSGTVPTQRSAAALALGARIGVQMIWTPVERQTSSNALVNLVSRSRIRNLDAAARSPRSRRRLRACWATHGPVGWAVTVGCRNSFMQLVDGIRGGVR